MSIRDFFKRGNADTSKLPSYEETHDQYGNYIGALKQAPPTPQAPPQQQMPPMFYMPMQPAGYIQQPPQEAPPLQHTTMKSGQSQADVSLYTAPLFSGSASKTDKNQRLYNNMVVYEPRTPEEVQTLIDYMARKEPAIINLDNVESEVAQRVLDFASGAIYALNGSVHRLSGNIFILSPEGIDISTLK